MTTKKNQYIICGREIAKLPDGGNIGAASNASYTVSLVKPALLGVLLGCAYFDFFKTKSGPVDRLVGFDSDILTLVGYIIIWFLFHPVNMGMMFRLFSYHTGLLYIEDRIGCVRCGIRDISHWCPVWAWITVIILMPYLLIPTSIEIIRFPIALGSMLVLSQAFTYFSVKASLTVQFGRARFRRVVMSLKRSDLFLDDYRSERSFKEWRKAKFRVERIQIEWIFFGIFKIIGYEMANVSQLALCDHWGKTLQTLRSKLTYSEDASRAMLDLGRVASNHVFFHAATYWLDNACMIAESTGNTEQLFAIINQRAINALKLGEFEQAEQHCNDLQKIACKIVDTNANDILYQLRAILCWRRNDLEGFKHWTSLISCDTRYSAPSLCDTLAAANYYDLIRNRELMWLNYTQREWKFLSAANQGAEECTRLRELQAQIFSSFKEAYLTALYRTSHK
jgi:hypothetical protein